MTTGPGPAAEFAASLPWPLDPFQEQAIAALDRSMGVLVSAPTSAGKTVVAEYAIFRALREGRQAIYTTPLKALSNQKYHDLCHRHGEDSCGLVTGENNINDLAPIVVMTTEILRNLIYENPTRLTDVAYVILDEVHYIDEFPRGSVWEEVIMQTPPGIRFIGLSATIANHDEVADWMSRHRGPIETVSVVERPVELRMWLALGSRFHPLFGPDGNMDHRTWQRAQTQDEAVRGMEHLRRLPDNDLLQVIESLSRQDMLPAIYFIFSRRGCREALQRAAQHGIDLTTDAEKALIEDAIAEHMRSIRDPDEAELYLRYMNGDMLIRGLAAHHAGLLPYLKEMVEHLFQRGLLKLVFATETLSLGLNMPARAVVVSTFTKFDGVNFTTLTTGELTQLMGRAGRRGIDTVGDGVILKEGDVDIGTIYEVAMGEGLVVESKFLPSYNMTLNLLRHRSPEEAERLMEGSFGQYQKDRAAERMRRRVEIVTARVSDLEQVSFRHPVEPCDESTIDRLVELEGRRYQGKLELRRLRRENWRARAGTPPGRRHHGRSAPSVDDPRYRALEAEMKVWQREYSALPCHRCPFLVEHRSHQADLRSARADLARSRREVESLVGEYARRMARLREVLERTGFTVSDAPTAKGTLASRVYGENNLLVVEAIEEGWLDQLRPEELAAALVMLCAEDRGRDRGPRPARRFPTQTIGETARRLRSLYFRFSSIEREHDLENLRPMSFDYVDFTYRWCMQDPLPTLPLPPATDFGDAIKAVKSLYSTLRQLEWALPSEDVVRATVRGAISQLERDVIRKI
ncbi:MAG: DEAD/DEAH box helicase [Candidatus Dormibacteria bacterium]